MENEKKRRPRITKSADGSLEERNFDSESDFDFNRDDHSDRETSNDDRGFRDDSSSNDSYQSNYNRDRSNDSYGNRGGYGDRNSGGGGYQDRNSGGGYGNRGGGYQDRNSGGGGYQDRNSGGGYGNRGGGYQDRNSGGGGYQDRNSGGGYGNRGGYGDRNSGGGGYQDRNSGGGYGNRGGGYQDRNSGGGGYQDRNSGGGYGNRGGGYQDRNSGGGYQDRNSGGGYGNRGGGYQDRNSGGGGYGNRGGGYQDRNSGGGGYQDRGGYGGGGNRGGGYQDRGGYGGGGNRGGGYQDRGGYGGGGNRGGGYQDRGGYGGGGNRGGGYQDRGGYGGGNRGGGFGKKPFGKKPAQDFHVQILPKAEMPTGEGMPLNKFLAHCGLASRRKAVDFIEQGLVTVNGQVITEPYYRYQIGDAVTCEGKTMEIQERQVYVLLNKPKNIITTTDDEHGRPTVLDIVDPHFPERIFPVGRLDRDTTGLILLTNDGEMAQKLTHPSHFVQKQYRIGTDRGVSQQDLERIARGVELDDGLVNVSWVRYAEDHPGRDVLEMEITEGRNRIVRRLFEAMGYEVKKLDRFYFAGLTKKDLPRGQFRELTQREVVMLKHFTGHPRPPKVAGEDDDASEMDNDN